ncbi:MAG: GGDEF domain-containing protein [Chloroflexota bacterium]
MDNNLRKIHLFQGLSDEDLARLAPYLQPRELLAGEILFHKDDPGDTVYFIESGQVAVYDPGESSLAVRTFGPGSLFGELAVIDRQPRTLSARAESDCQLWALSAAGFEGAILDNKTLVMNILVNLSASIRYTTDIFMEAARRSLHDALTGLYNRGLFESLLDVLEENRRQPASLVMVDIDGLKHTNDSLGHAAGDLLLQRAAAILRSAFRAEDVVARIGGDEFAVVLPGVDEKGASEALARLQARLEAHRQAHPDLPVDFSAGAATRRPGETLEATLQRADARMYAHKAKRKPRSE